jgi:hypothetical protein
MQDFECELPRTLLLGTQVNKAQGVSTLRLQVTNVSLGKLPFLENRRGVELMDESAGQEAQQHGTASGIIPGGPELAFEEFVKLRTEGEEVNRSVRQSRTVAQMNKMFAEINAKYDSEFVGPPL